MPRSLVQGKLGAEMMALVTQFLPVFLAPFVGSFLGVLVQRLPAGRPIALARSSCDSCGRSLSPAELVPLASYVAQRGRCRGCRAPLSAFYPAIELAAMLPAAWAVLAAGDAPQAWADAVLGWMLLALCWIDLRHLRLPDALTLPLVVAGIGATWLLDPPRLVDHAVGALLGFAAFTLLAMTYQALRGRQGLGAGDAKLLAAGGAWVGWDQLPAVVLIAAAGGIALAGLMAVGGARLTARTAIPFGAPLGAGIWLIRLYGSNW